MGRNYITFHCRFLINMANDIELVMLGTGSAMVTKCFNTCFAMRSGDETFLVDAGGGNGILAQLEKANISIDQIHKAFLTHGHTDHVLGMIWVVRKVIQAVIDGNYSGGFYLYGHEEVLAMLNTFCQMSLLPRYYAHVGKEVHFVPLQNGDEFEAVGCKFTSFDIGSTKAKQFGFVAQLPNGERLACLGDEPFNETARPLVEKVQWLMSEAFCLYADRDLFKPYEKHHSTALDAAKTAQSLAVKNLILYHTIDNDLLHRAQQYTAEVKEHYTGEVYVPNDLDCIALTCSKP